MIRAGFETAKGLVKEDMHQFRPKTMTWNSKYSTTAPGLMCLRPTDDWQENIKGNWMAVHYLYQQGESLGGPVGREAVVSETTHTLSCCFTHWAPYQARAAYNRQFQPDTAQVQSEPQFFVSSTFLWYYFS